jgi:large repetitive protein
MEMETSLLVSRQVRGRRSARRVLLAPALLALLASGIADQSAGATTSPAALTDPTVTLSMATGQTSPTNQTTVNLDAVFSQPVTGFDGGDITVTGATGTVTATVTGSGATYSIVLTGFATDGTAAVAIVAAAATDTSDQQSAASNTVEITIDTEKPVIVDPGQQTVPRLGAGPVTYPLPIATDNHPDTTVACSPAPGSIFPIGTTAVTCTAIDAAQNSSTLTFNVVVLDGSMLPATL